MRHPLERIVSQPWYLLDAPWAHGDYAGTMILAGSPDPHVGLVVCDTNDLLSGETDVETARAVAEHIVDLHNDSVQADYQRLQANHERLQAECKELRRQRDDMAMYKVAAHQLIGIPASVGISEPVEGFAESPGEIMPAVRDMALKIEALQAERDAAFALLRECQLILREECGARIDYVELNAFLKGRASAMDILAALDDTAGCILCDYR